MISASQIVADACSIAKVPGYVAQGGRALNLVLNDLCLHRNLKMLRQQATISLSAGSNGPFTLPANYLRTYDLFYTINNFPYFLFEITQEDYDQLFKDPSIANYPYCYATDLTGSQTPGSTTQIFVFPQSNSAISLTHRYMINMPDISAPETSATTPWFPDQDYLIKATATRLMDFSDDERKQAFLKNCEDMLRTHLIMEGDEQQTPHTIRLDPRRFRISNRIRPTKLNPY